MKAKEAAEIIKGIEEVRGSLPEDGLLVDEALNMAIKALELFGISEQLPSTQPDIIRCNACKHWTQTTGDMPGFGLGDCDYLNAKFVTCNGYCYWAERREE